MQTSRTMSYNLYKEPGAKSESLKESCAASQPKTATNRLIGRTSATPKTVVRFHFSHLRELAAVMFDSHK